MEPGTRLNHYRILRRLGSGGMGDVYAALDSKLDREVALKVLPAEMASDPERRHRFEREARAVAALDHPNIVTIHTVEQAEGDDGPVHFLTMQRVDGETLDELIPRQGFPTERFFELAVPLADAIGAAHRQGITHRDLKPSNVMVGADGRVMVLDFGLAKLAVSGVPAGTVETGAAEFPTAAATEHVTEEGKILGTVSYMSPEQAEGKAIDARSDVFALGIVLYEMATGERPFKGDTKVSIMSSIVKETPTSITDLNRTMPRHLGRIIKKCLEKDPQRRYESALGIRNDLEELAEEVRSGEVLPVAAMSGAPARAGRVALYAGAAVVIVGAIVVGYLVARLGSAGIPDDGRWTFTQLTRSPAIENRPSLSPDGRFVVYSSDEDGDVDIYRRRVAGENAQNLTAVSTADDWDPAFSPSGEQVAFRSNRGPAGIWLMGATGENQRLLQEGGFAPSWSPDGRRIVYSSVDVVNPRALDGLGGLVLIEVADPQPRQLHATGFEPAWSPSGDRIVYFDVKEGGQRDLFTIPVEGGTPVPLTDDEFLDWSPTWSPDGRFVYFSSDRGGDAQNIWRLGVDERSGAPRGEPEPIGISERDQGWPSISTDGSAIAYASMRDEGNVQRIAIDPVTGTVAGDPEWITAGSNSIVTFDVSPDGEWLVYSMVERQEDLGLVRTDGGSDPVRLTDDVHRDRSPQFSPDGERIAFQSDRSGAYQAWILRLGGPLIPTQVTFHDGPQVWEPFWSPDATKMGYFVVGEGVFLIDTETPWDAQTPEHLPGLPEGGRPSSWSPDGSRIVGHYRGGFWVFSLEDQRYELFELGHTHGAWLGDDGRRLVILRTRPPSALAIMDLETREETPLLEAGEGWTFYHSLAVRDGGHSVYFGRHDRQSDIWLMRRER